VPRLGNPVVDQLGDGFGLGGFGQLVRSSLSRSNSEAKAMLTRCWQSVSCKSWPMRRCSRSLISATCRSISLRALRSV
jgi:hypothetical protein